MKTETWANIGLASYLIVICFTTVVRLFTFFGVGKLGATEANPLYTVLITDYMPYVITIPFFLFALITFYFGYHAKKMRLKYAITNPLLYHKKIRFLSMSFVFIALIMVYNIWNDFNVLNQLIMLKCAVI